MCQLRLASDREGPDEVRIYENFNDQTAFDFHFRQPYVQTWIELAESYGATFDVGFWHGLT
jgi:quinol monooxygenase YgiN